MNRIMVTAACAALLAACGGDNTGETGAAETAVGTDAAEVVLDNGMTVAEAVDKRQQGYKSLGRAFKTTNDELKKGEPDVAVISEAVGEVNRLAGAMPSWFPAGTGPESGVETEALPVIWDEPEDFAAKVANLQMAVAELQAAAGSGDMDAIGAAVKTVGGACQSCHKKFRLDDD